ncbi:hypothetical protein THAOC_25816 [Thalassiosira oceanica]|uniref:peptidylprolyl isomerase n=1 Tax=Thalassiosira oceanica TaxID=159749 RepID=K0RLE3_THAOC|nr:hypothetical protein THAOC_25816 [Thalassiosira oceanica]|eukprot:EJK54543.1 hypothetical protein THAOC_25816 [Thalassiosira oceanica]
MFINAVSGTQNVEMGGRDRDAGPAQNYRTSTRQISTDESTLLGEELELHYILEFYRHVGNICSSPVQRPVEIRPLESSAVNHVVASRKMKSCMLLLSCVAPSAAFVAPSGPAVNTALAAQQSRTEFLRDVTATVGASVVVSTLGGMPAYADEVLPSGNKIDDIFETPEPYYTRIGSGGLIKGVEEVLPKMVVGDRWVLTVPGPLAFGPAGRKASAGKPRIPGNQEIIFDVEMVGLPGKEQELIDIIGD